MTFRVTDVHISSEDDYELENTPKDYSLKNARKDISIKHDEQEYRNPSYYHSNSLGIRKFED